MNTINLNHKALFRFISVRFSNALYISFLCFFTLLMLDAQAGNKTWVGDVNAVWNNANNWDGDILPVNGDQITIDPSSYTTAPVISANSAFSPAKVNILNGALLTIQADLTCTDEFKLDGDNTTTPIVNMTTGTLTINGNKLSVKKGSIFNFTGGTINISDDLAIEDATFNMNENDGTSTLNIDYDADNAGMLSVKCKDANALFNQDAGTVSIGESLLMDGDGNGSTYSATLDISGGTFTNDGITSFRKKNGDDTPVNISGGTVTLTGDVSNSGGTMNFDVSGGSLSFQGNLTLDNDDQISQSGGTITFEGGDKDWDNDGTFTATAGTVVFNDVTNTELIGIGTYNFYHVTISSGATMSQSGAANINVAGNWTNSGGTFNENTNNVTFNGSGVQTVTGETFYGLTVDKSVGNISFSGDAAATHQLTMTQGDINLNSNLMTLGTGIGNPGTLTYSDGTIIGRFKRWINSTGTGYEFPIGTSSIHALNTLTFTNLSNGSLTMEFIAGDPGSSGLPLVEGLATVTNQFTEGYWNLTPADGLSSTNYAAQAETDDFSSYTADANTRLIKRTSGANPWILQGSHTAAGNQVGRTGLNGAAAQFTLGKTTCLDPTAMVIQNNTNPTPQGGTDQEILRVQVFAYGTSCTNEVTSFTFNTGGTPGSDDPANDLNNAKVYYTGSSATFSTATLFGALGSAPNGNFNVSGSQIMYDDTVYFWLAYDIATGASKDNKVDANLVSFISNGSTITAITDPDPAGSRTIKEERYAVATGNWNQTSTWSWYSGGPSGASVPLATTNVFIEGGYEVTVNSAGEVAKNITLSSNASIGKLTILGTGSLTADSVSISTTNEKVELHLENTGSMSVNGGIYINNSGAIENSAKTICLLDDATMTINNDLDLYTTANVDLGVWLENNGELTLGGNMNFSADNSDRAFLAMKGNGVMNIAGSFNILPGKYGMLYNVDGNHNTTINFNGTTPQILELTPDATNSAQWQYSNVWINNTAGVTLNNDITKDEDYNTIQKTLVIQSGFLSTGGYSIQFPRDHNASFEVQDGATFLTTTTDAYGGMPYFGNNQDRGNITLGSTSTVIFGASANQAVPGLSGVDGSNYGNIVIAGTGTKTLTNAHDADFSGNTGNITLENDLTIENGATLDVSANNYTIDIKGNWLDENAVASAGFTARSGLVRFTGTANQTIDFTALQTFNDVTVNKSSGDLVLADDIVVSNNLTMTQGDITTSTNKLTLGTGAGNPGTLSRTSGTIIGKFERWANATGSDYLFPIGTASWYRPATVNFTDLTSGSLIMEFISADPGNNGLPLTDGYATVTDQFTEGYWDFTAANGLASTDYDVTLSTNGFTSYPATTARVLKRVNPASPWTADGTYVHSGSDRKRIDVNGISTPQFALFSGYCNDPTAKVIQSNLNPVAQGTPDHDILKIAVYAYGTSCVNNVTQFTFNTGGIPGCDDAANDLDDAKVYYTADSDVFSAATLFGTLGSTPNGNFTITGNQDMYEDTVYFWLVYDISTAATVDNVVDANLVSFVAGGNTLAAATSDPAGSRTIRADRYAVASDDWDKASTWAYYSGGPPGAPEPTADNMVFIEGTYEVTIDKAGEVAENIYITSNGTDKGKLKITDLGTFTVDSVFLTSTVSKTELHIDKDGQMTVNGDIRLDGSGATENGDMLKIKDDAILTINGNLLITNSGNSRATVKTEDNSILYMNGNINFDGTNAGQTRLAMKDDSRIDLTGAISILPGKRGILLNEDGLHNSVINFTGTSPQVIELTPDNSNSDQWQYSNIWINNTAGVTLNADVTEGPTYATIQKTLIVQTGTLNSGGFSLQLTNSANALFEVQNGATYYTTTTDDYGGIAYFGNNEGNGQITLGATSTIHFAAASDQNIPGITGANSSPYGHIILSGGGTKTVTAAHHNNFDGGTGDLDIDGNLTISDGTELDVSNNNYDIYIAGNWTDNNTVVDAGFNRRSGTVEFNGTADQTITFPALQTFSGLTVNKSGGDLLMPQTVVAADQITMTQGNVVPSGPAKFCLGLSPANPGTLAHTSGTVVGKMERWINATGFDYLFPVGTATNYRPDVINFTDLTNGSLIVEFIAADPGNNGLPLAENAVSVTDQFTEGYWDHTAVNSLASTDYNVSLTGNGFVSYPVNNRTRVIKRTSGASPWVLDGSPVTAGGMTAYRNSMNAIVTAQMAFATATCGSFATSTSGVEPTCNGFSNGSVDLTVSGGREPYVYIWSSGQPTQDLTSITAGTYDVTVTDEDLCVETDSYVLGEPAALGTTVTVSTDYNGEDISCNGASDGGADLTVSGGTGPYTFAWSNGETVEDAVTLNDGTHTVTVTDANGCTLTDNITLNEPAALSATAVVSTDYNGEDISCNGASDGGADLTVSGGVIPYTYAWSNSETTEDISGLAAGTYDVTVTDANGCTTTTNVTLTEPTALSASAVVSTNYNGEDISCNGASDGGANLTPGGGVTPYTFAWSNGETGEDAVALDAGTHTVTVTDANGCTASTSVALTEPVALTASAVVTTNYNGEDISCNGASDGGADLTVSGGTGPLTYTWSNGETVEDAVVLNAGTHTVTVTDVNGCTISTDVTLTEPAALTASAVVSTNYNGEDISCNGASDGGADLTVTGGVGPFTYAWSNGETTEDASSLAAGTATVTITDNNGCSVSTSVVLTEPAALTASAVVSTDYNGEDISCNGASDGGADLTVTGGTSPFTYAWSNSETTEDISGLAAGTYDVTVTDANGCTISTNVTLTEPAALTASAVVSTNYNGQNISCNGASDGGADLTVGGGTAPYSYAWSNSETTEDITGLPAGTYNVTVTDANGCTVADDITLTEPAALTASAVVSTNYNGEDISCNGASDGGADLTVTGGVGPFTYAWSNGETTEDASSLAAGTATVTITDNNGCTASTSIALTEPAALTASAVVSTDYNGEDISCNGASDGGADLTVTGGTSPFTYAWSNSETTEDISGLAAGTYHVTVTDANSCTIATNVTLTEPAALTASAVVSTDYNGEDISCNGASDGGADLTVGGGTAPFTYVWSNAETIEDISGLAAGIYDVTVTDANGCTIATNVTLTEPAATSISLAVSSNYNGEHISCVGASDGAINLTPGVGIAPYTYNWSNGATTEDISGLNAGTYVVTMTDANGCTVNDSITLNDPPALVITWGGNNVTTIGGSDGNLDITVSGGVATYSYAWSTGASTEDISGLTEGTYTVTITDQNGCTKIDAVTLTDPVAIYDEPFNYADGTTTSGQWSLDLSNADPKEFQVESNSFYVKDTDGEAVWRSSVIDISSYADLLATVRLWETEDMKSADYVRIYYKLDGGAEVLFSTNGNLLEEFGSVTASQTIPCGSNTLQIIIRTNVKKEFNFDDVFVYAPVYDACGDKTDITCAGANDGSIDIRISRGVIPYTYLWSTGDTTRTISDLTAGSYTFTVTDKLNNSITESVTITEPDTLTTDMAVNPGPMMCYGYSSGQVDLSVYGGAPGYTYMWSTGQTTQDLSWVNSGDFYVTVTDSRGCAVVDSGFIDSYPQIFDPFVATDASLYTTNDGSIDLTASGGAGPLSFEWASGETTEDLTDLFPGLYSFTITDSIGCTEGAAVEIGYDTPKDSLGVGSYIINMGVTPQTYANGLKPYGLVYHLVNDYKIPVKWVINPDKELGGIDFSHNGVDYRGGAFVIEADFMSPTIESFINTWEAMGVVGNKTVSPICVPVFHTIKGLTNVVIDEQNEGIIIPYFDNASFPTSYYSVGLPSNLDECSDTYILPHADPTWPTHKYLLDFVTEQKGYVWAGCHAVSVLEGIHDPVDPSIRMNFLSNQGLQCFGGGKCGDLITEDHDGNPTLPYIYDSTLANHPIMQNIGEFMEASENGSEKWYIPITGGRWNHGASIPVATSDSALSAPGVKVIFGRAFDNPENGLIMYQGGHKQEGGDEDENTAAQRAFFNFIYLSSIDKSMKIIDSIPATFIRDSATLVSAVVEKGKKPYGYYWTSECGVFADPYAQTTTFTIDAELVTSWCYVTLEVTDSCGRFAFEKIRISLVTPNAVATDYNGYNISCYGASDGAIDLSVQGGTPPYTYEWSTGDTIEDLTGLTSGPYIVTVTDSMGYWDVDSLYLTQPDSINTSFDVTDVTCAGDGAIDMTVTGGVPAYSFNWSNGETTEDLSNLSAGWYLITVTDLNSCTLVDSAEVLDPGILSLSTTATDVTCVGSDGTIDLSVSGGQPPYTYLWSTGATTQDIGSLTVGSYTVTVTDNNGCEGITSQNVNSISGISNNPSTVTDVSCNGGNDGAIDQTVSGGVPPYTIHWSTGDTTEDVSGLTAGNYTVTITDNIGCNVTIMETVSEPTALAISATKTDINCNGESNGSIDLTISGGTTPYVFSWSNGPATEDISGLIAGSYTVTVTDSLGCNLTNTDTIVEPILLTAFSNKTNVTCNGMADGTISLSVSGGTLPYNYNWSSGDTIQDIDSLSPGTYTVTVTDDHSCTAVDGATITEPVVPTVIAIFRN